MDKIINKPSLQFSIELRAREIAKEEITIALKEFKRQLDKFGVNP